MEEDSCSSKEDFSCLAGMKTQIAWLYRLLVQDDVVQLKTVQRSVHTRFSVCFLYVPSLYICICAHTFEKLGVHPVSSPQTVIKVLPSSTTAQIDVGFWEIRPTTSSGFHPASGFARA